MQPFKIQVPDSVLDDLRERLSRTRFPDQIDGVDWKYGADLEYMKELCAYWRDKFDWREQERRLNQFDQFTTEIDGLKLHFINQRSKQANALPLIITHGWPGSFFEFHKIIGPLTDPVAHGGKAKDAFHVICPSMPGYGFSDRPRQPGFDVRSTAELQIQLMQQLGYERYGAQGGDWGSFVTTWMGALDAERCCGIHLNLMLAGPPEGDPNPMEGLTDADKAALARSAHYDADESGYYKIQATRPQSLGYGLNDSPVGLAAWLTEKFYAWTDCNGHVENAISKDELLTNIMIYWATQTITSSTRMYYENLHSGRFGPAERVEVPTGAANFPAEILGRPPRRWAEARFNITQWTDMPRGGHFAALEQPELLVDDLRSFFRELR